MDLERRQILRSIREINRDDYILYTLCVLYFAGVTIAAITVDELECFSSFNYLPLWMMSSINLVVLYVIVAHALPAIKIGSRHFLKEAVSSAYRGIPQGRFVAGILLILVNGIFWSLFTAVKNLLPDIAPVWLDQQIADIDHALHGGIDPWRQLQLLLGHHLATRVIEIVYLNSWLLCVIAFPTFLAFRSGADSLRNQYFATSFLVLIVLGTIGAALGMSAGPVYYGHVTGDTARFSALVDYLSFSRGSVSSAADIQDYLWLLLKSDETHLGSGISAFPSIHVAMATLFWLTARRMNAKLGAAFLFYLIVILAGSVHLGWHYAVDGYASIIGTYAIWCLVEACPSLEARARLQAQVSWPRPAFASNRALSGPVVEGSEDRYAFDLVPDAAGSPVRGCFPTS